MYAIHGKHLQVSEKLILSGSDVTIKDKVHTIVHDPCNNVTNECMYYKTISSSWCLLVSLEWEDSSANGRGERMSGDCGTY